MVSWGNRARVGPVCPRGRHCHLVPEAALAWRPRTEQSSAKGAAQTKETGQKSRVERLTQSHSVFHVKHAAYWCSSSSPSHIKGVILDLDGTLYRDNLPIPGAPESIEELRAQGYSVVFVTNAVESPTEHAAKLAALNIAADADDIVTASTVLLRQLSLYLPHATLFPICDPPLLKALQPTYRISEDPDLIDVVIASCDLSFSYHKLNVGFQALRRGARFWATNIDATWPIGEGEVPDAGAVIGALEACSRRKVELVAGKPSALVTETVLARLALPARQCVIVGDRLETDIVMGHQAGMRTALVLTGVTQRKELIHAPVQPDHVLESIVEVPLMLAGLASPSED